MRMGVEVAGLSVRCPPGVAYSAVTHGAALFHKLFAHVLKLALGLDCLDASLFKNCDARAVITAVFQLFKPVHKYVGAVAPTDITHNSAHIFSSDRRQNSPVISGNL